MSLQWFHSILDETEQSLLFFLPSISEKAQSQISVYKSLHLSIISMHHSWQPKTCASMTAEVFDVDHEANPPLGLYPWLRQTQFAGWMSVILLHFWFSVLCICLSLFSPWEDRTKICCQSITEGSLVLSEHFWVYSVSLEALDIFCWWFSSCMHWPCGKTTLGGSKVISQCGGAKSILVFKLLQSLFVANWPNQKYSSNPNASSKLLFFMEFYFKFSLL